MTITVYALKCALEEAAQASLATNEPNGGLIANSLMYVADNAFAVTILAEKLSVRPPTTWYGKALSELSMVELLAAIDKTDGGGFDREAYNDLHAEWLSRQTAVAVTGYTRENCPTELGRVCEQGQLCCQRRPGR